VGVLGRTARRECGLEEKMGTWLGRPRSGTALNEHAVERRDILCWEYAMRSRSLCPHDLQYGDV